MADYRALFIKTLEDKGVSYESVDDNTIVIDISANGVRDEGFSFYVTFHNSDDHVSLMCVDIANVPDDRRTHCLEVLNEYNGIYRWAKFFIDKQGDLLCVSDVFVSEDTCGKACMEVLRRVYSVLMNSYGQIVKLINGQDSNTKLN